MGVPKFYRWTSERYPCLSQVVREHQIPEFDNLYLDMNGIIHVCSHPNDDDPQFRISEAEIFKNIFHYIEVLFRTIKPRKNFFMAVDGVAPRAKMNQQRGRRFRTAKEAEDNIKRAIEKGQTLPKEERFDSNCITPGTQFMAQLNTHLQYFVNKKISSDPLWQGCNVYLSGHDVPGEGEHKIMDFIRSEKSKDDYDPNTRHCLYGLDADLIMLGLVTHEPHFSLLREEVRFGKQSKRVTKPEETTFLLLHLSLMREYLDFEFSQLKDSLPFEYDLEKIIDDWVLLGFLVGNDFIPNLPDLHINHDAFPYLYKIYMEVMPDLDGYLHDGGFLNLPRFQKFLTALGKFDREKFEDRYVDMKWLEGRTGRSLTSGKKYNNQSGKIKFSQLMSQLDDDIMLPVRNPYMALADVSDAFDDSLVASPPRTLDHDGENIEDVFGKLGIKDADGGEELFEMEFKQHKRAYYMDKFQVPVADNEFIAKVAFEYVLAIQWTLHYYFNGLQSWSWYYPFHYAPFLSDIIDIEAFDLTLDKGEPFKPFEQLLAVLPSASMKLLPKAFQSLMVMDTSPIIDYYPTSFKTDLNGKQQEWEAIVLIPFINENRLLSAMAPNYARLTNEEKQRNSYGSCLKYQHSTELNFKFSSTFPGVFRDIDSCRANCEKIDKDAFRAEIKDLKKGLCDGVKENVYFPGFPTLKHIPHNTKLFKAGVRVFGYSSKSNNMVVHIAEMDKPSNEAMRELVGKTVHVEWPYLIEALVTGITDGEVKYFLKEPENRVQEDIVNKNKSDDARNWMNIVKKNYIEKKGINTGDVNVLVEAKPLKGKRYKCGAKGSVTLEKEWDIHHAFYPYQAIVQDLTVHGSENQNEYESVEDLYPVDSSCFIMASPHYGCAGKVLGIDQENNRVRLALSVPPEPDLSDAINSQPCLADKYHHIDAVAQQLGISNNFLSRVTGGLFVLKQSKDPGKNSDRVNIGLKLKFSGQNREVLGYARRSDEGWTFSQSAVDVLRSYLKRFPDVFKRLSSIHEQEIYNEKDIFPNKTGKDSLQDVLDFLKTLPCYKLGSVMCGSSVLDEKIVSAIETAVYEAKLKSHSTKSVTVKVKPYVLFRPTAKFGSLVPDPFAEYYLFDRVVHVRDGGAVPLGYRGTVIGVHQVREDEKDENSPSTIKYEILFDEPFLGGLKTRCEENKGAYMDNSSLLNLTHGKRKEGQKKGLTTSSMTRLVQKAEPRTFKKTSSSSSLQHYSPFSPRRGTSAFSPSPSFDRQKGFRKTNVSYSNSSERIANTPMSSKGARSKGYNDDGNGVGSDECLMSPEYWLKGYGSHDSAKKSPSKQTRDENELTKKKLTVMKKSDNPESDENRDFLSLLNKLSGEPKPNPQKAILKKDPDTQRQNTNRTDQTKPAAALAQPDDMSKKEPVQIKKSPDMKSLPQHDINIDRTSNYTPPRPSMNVLDKLFQQPQSPQPVMNFPASPTSPAMPGSPLSPTAVLQNWCHQNQMPAPSYICSVTPQGVHAVVKIGPAICYGGLMCRTKADAADSAADVAYRQLLQRQAEVENVLPRNIPVQQTGPHKQLAQSNISTNQGRFMFSSPAQINPLLQGMVPRQMNAIPGQFPQVSPIRYHDAFGYRHCHSTPQHQSPIRAPVMSQAFLYNQQQQQHIYRMPRAFEASHSGPMKQNDAKQMLFEKTSIPDSQQFARSQDSQIQPPNKRGADSIKTPSDISRDASSKMETSVEEKVEPAEAVQHLFVPLQVNRAKKAAKKLESAVTDLSASNVSSVTKQDKRSLVTDEILVEQECLESSQSAASTEKQHDATSTESPSATEIVNQEQHSTDDVKTANKNEPTETLPTTQKTSNSKRNVLLAPSFFASKK